MDPSPPTADQPPVLNTPPTDASKPSAHISVQSVREYPDMQQAQEAAHAVQMATGGRIYPCTIFKQADRYQVSTCFPLAALNGLLQTQPASKEADPRTAQNRPVDPDHVKAIRDYVVQNVGNYVLPGLSVTYRDALGIFTVNIGKFRQGYLVIPDGQFAYITDGQHRYLALVGYRGSRPEIEGALARQPELQKDSIAVQITVEDNMQRIHQDFADMAVTKPLPKSLLTAYDLRDPVNRLVYEVVDQTPLFRGRIDETSKTLSVKSRHIALSNWIRNYVKGAIATDYFVAEEEVPRFVKECLADEGEVNQLRDDLLQMVHSMTNNIPPLKAIAAIPPTSPAADKVAALRSDVLATTAVGLGISGMVLRVIRMEIADPAARQPFIDAIYTRVNWLRKNADGSVDPAWTHGGVLDGESIKTSRSNIFTSTARIVERIGLPLAEKLQKYFAKASSGSTVASVEDRIAESDVA